LDFGLAQVGFGQGGRLGGGGGLGRGGIQDLLGEAAALGLDR
jgi:hypothetical protein